MRKLLPDQFKASKNNCGEGGLHGFDGNLCHFLYSFFKILTIEGKNMSIYHILDTYS